MGVDKGFLFEGKKCSKSDCGDGYTYHENTLKKELYLNG